jgi:FkbM family methyltransferase
LNPIAYIQNRLKEAARRAMPAHVRFRRAGESFLRDGEREVHLLPQLVSPGTVAIDVGAHIGDYSYSLCKHVGAGGHVIAIEPLPDLARMLQTAARKLRLPMTVINCALSAEPGFAELHVPINNGKRAAGFATLENRALDGQTHRVELRTLDSICDSAPARISFIKIDVEGHELKVLRGAQQALARHRPNLLIEIEQRHSPVAIQDTLGFVEALGYRGTFLDPNQIEDPLSEFRAERHQSAPGSPEYVSNFIFRPS